MASIGRDISGHTSSEDDAILLSLLDVIERDPAVTQRTVARELGIALGLANAYLRRCVRKGFVKVSQVPRRRYAYFLTPQGFAEKSRLTADYLSHSFSFFRKARAQCDELFANAAAEGRRRLALVGDGDLAEIARLVARDHPVAILGVISARGGPTQLKADAADLGPIDGVIVTALVSSREVFEAAAEAFGSDKIYAPALLRLSAALSAKDSGGIV